MWLCKNFSNSFLGIKKKTIVYQSETVDQEISFVRVFEILPLVCWSF